MKPRVLLAALALTVGASACSVPDSDKSGVGATTTTTPAASDSTTTTQAPAEADPSKTIAPLTATGLGALRLGMSEQSATQTGMIGPISKGCELATGQTTADLKSPYVGTATFQDGSLETLMVRSGAQTDPGGVATLTPLDVAKSAWESAGMKVVVDKSREESFGEWFIEVSDQAGKLVFTALAEPGKAVISVIAAPHVPTCE